MFALWAQISKIRITISEKYINVDSYAYSTHVQDGVHICKNLNYFVCVLLKSTQYTRLNENNYYRMSLTE
jgi:hypothetical protein